MTQRGEGFGLPPSEGGVTPLSRPRLYEQLADHIADFIDAQGLAPGDRLPPERALAKSLGVSRATLSRALVALEVRGRLQVRHGDGAVVRDPEGTVALPSLDEAVLSEVLAARLPTMTALAQAAAQRGDSAVRAALFSDDGTRRSLDDVWDCVLRLVPFEQSLLREMDAALAAKAAQLGMPRAAPEAVARLADAMRRGTPGDIADACSAALGLTTTG
jgi:GntR family transcriptional repressor for pyruvate dehydrogenase complex